jgi:hypothetical protein
LMNQEPIRREWLAGGKSESLAHYREIKYGGHQHDLQPSDAQKFELAEQDLNDSQISRKFHRALGWQPIVGFFFTKN